jgi:hypothetical protein
MRIVAMSLYAYGFVRAWERHLPFWDAVMCPLTAMDHVIKQIDADG